MMRNPVKTSHAWLDSSSPGKIWVPCVSVCVFVSSVGGVREETETNGEKGRKQGKEEERKRIGAGRGPSA